MINDQNRPTKILACDLGYDSLYSIDLDYNIEKVYEFERGTGPRHLRFDSKGNMYVVSEMSC